MAHEIDMSAGYAAAAFARKPAWHGLGKVMPGQMTAEEALKEAGLDWGVEMHPIYRPNRDGDLQMIEGRRCVVRDDTWGLLGHVSDKFVPLQNSEQCDFINSLIGQGAMVESAGSLRDGKRIWFLVDLKTSFDALPGDEIHNYLLSINGHDGMTCWQGVLTDVRVVCANTLSMALEDTESKFGRFVKLRHNGNLEANIEMARNALMLGKKRSEIAAAEAKALVKRKMDTEALGRFFSEQVAKMGFSSKEREELVVDQLRENLDSPTNSLKGMRGTAWQAFNVLSEWVDHAPRKVGAGVRFESVMLGEGSKIKTNAWKTLLETAV